MHLSDAFISPAIAGVFTLLSAVPLVMALRKVREEPSSNIPLMGVLGAFVFAIQMLNFSIPGTGSSGHLTGGILLAALLGPFRGYLVMTSILVIQCLFFADGGLMALGCNLFNMGVCSCLIAYPLLFAPWKQSLSKLSGRKRFTQCTLVSLITCSASAVLGAFFVTLQTELSGVTEWPFQTFLTCMVTIHLLIGLIEGVATSALLCFLLHYKPELLRDDTTPLKSPKSLPPTTSPSAKGKSYLGLLLLTLCLGTLAPQMASSLPDGLEWSIEQVHGEKPDSHRVLERIQCITAFMPDYEGDMAGLTGTLLVFVAVQLGGHSLQKKRLASIHPGKES